MKKLFSSASLIISILMFNACQKPVEIDGAGSDAAARQSTDKPKINIDLSVKGDYEVRDGILYFKSVDTFNALDKELRSLSPEKRVEFTRTIGFLSLLESQLVAYTLLSQAESKEEYNRVLSVNKDIIQQTDSKAISLFEEVSAALLSREGMVSVGGFVHCFAKGKQLLLPMSKRCVGLKKQVRKRMKALLFWRKKG